MRRLSAFLLLILIAGLFSPTTRAAETLVPETTKGLFVVPDVTAMEEAWNKIDLGKLAQDPDVEPFVKDMQEQIQALLDKTGVRVGVSLEELFDVCTGEIAVAFIKPRKGAQKHSVATIVDAAGKDAEVAKLRKKIAATMDKRKAKSATETVDGVELDIYTVPLKTGGRKTFKAVFFYDGEKIVAVDHEEVAKEILSLIKGGGGKTLKGVKGFDKTMARVVKESKGLEPHAYWWVDPLDYAMLTRDAAAIQKPRDWDVLTALSNQGFDGISGLGGHINLAAELPDGQPCDILWRGYCYAPGPMSEAARLLELPGKDSLVPEGFIDEKISSYASGTWQIGKSYDYIGSLVDEVVDEEGFFDDLIKSLEEDPNGPRINMQKDVVDHLATRASVLTDVKMPVKVDSERFLIAIELKDAKAFKKTLNKILEGDPNAELLEIDDEEIWEIITDSDEDPEIDIEGPGFDDFDSEEDNGGNGGGQGLMGDSAMAVINGHLLIASHADAILEVMRRKKNAPKLADASDYIAVQKALATIGSTKKDTGRLFSRVDEEMKAPYEFLREGNMPKSKGLLGRMLNQVLSSEDEEGTRKPQIKGNKMPEFAKIKDYFGRVGLYIVAEKGGFYGAGVALSKDQIKELEEKVEEVEGKIEEKIKDDE